MKIMAIGILGAATIGSTTLPIDDYAKLGAAGGFFLLTTYLIMKTIPDMMKKQSQDLASLNKSNTDNQTNLTNAFRQSMAEFREQSTRTTEQMVIAQHAAIDKLTDHLDKVESAITDGARQEAQLLRQLIQDKRS